MKFIFYIFSILPLLCCAEINIGTEDVLTETGKVRVDFGISYSNVEGKDYELLGNSAANSDNTTQVVLPSSLSEVRTNTDLFIGTLGLRYGLSKDTELFTRASYIASFHRATDGASSISAVNNQLSDAWIGINHRFSNEIDDTSTFGFCELSIYERNRTTSSKFKSILVGATVSHSIDPVVLGLTAAYRGNLSRHDGTVNYRPSNVFLLNPTLNFAVNDKLTLLSGIQWTIRNKERYDGTPLGITTTRSSLNLGASYESNKKSTLSLLSKSNISGNLGSDFILNFQYRY